MTTPKVAEPFFIRKQLQFWRKKRKILLNRSISKRLGIFCQGLGHYAHEYANKRIAIIKDDGEAELASKDDLEWMPKLDDYNDL
jgi:hypothetical protein